MSVVVVPSLSGCLQMQEWARSAGGPVPNPGWEELSTSWGGCPQFLSHEPLEPEKVAFILLRGSHLERTEVPQGRDELISLATVL